MATVTQLTDLLETATRAYQIARDNGGDSWFAQNTMAQVVILLESALSTDDAAPCNARAEIVIRRAKLATSSV